MYSKAGFKQNFPNGMIIETNPVLVKTQNGVVELTDIREGRDLIEKGMLL